MSRTRSAKTITEAPSGGQGKSSARPIPSGWRWAKLGDVVRNVNESERNPLAAGLKRFVGMEHIEPGNLQLRHWGDLADTDVTFTKRFRKGQVLFGKRRAYQRKVALAEFDGVCSSDILTLEVRGDGLIPELLPFVVQSDRFFEHAVGTSAGSLSPRTRWTQLEELEILLPPSNLQRAAAEELQHIDAAIAADKEFFRTVSELRGSLAMQYATAGGAHLSSSGVVEELPSGWSSKTVRDLCGGQPGALTLGPFGSDLTVSDYGSLSEGVPVIFVADVRRHKFKYTSGKYISHEKAAALSAHGAKPGDVLITEMGWPPGEACKVPDGWPASIVKADIIRARLDKEIMRADYFVEVINSHWGQQQVVRLSPGTTRPRMTLRDFERIRVATPPVAVQDKALLQFRAIERTLDSLNRRLEAAAVYRTARLESLLGGSDAIT